MSKSMLDKIWGKAQYIEDMTKENPHSMAIYLADLLEIIGVYPDNTPTKPPQTRKGSK